MPKRIQLRSRRRTGPASSCWNATSGHTFEFAATGFYYQINGLITQETDADDGLLVYNNVDEINAKGLELEAEGKWPTGLLRPGQLHVPG